MSEHQAGVRLLMAGKQKLQEHERKISIRRGFVCSHQGHMPFSCPALRNSRTKAQREGASAASRWLSIHARRFLLHFLMGAVRVWPFLGSISMEQKCTDSSSGHLLSLHLVGSLCIRLYLEGLFLLIFFLTSFPKIH